MAIRRIGRASSGGGVAPTQAQIDAAVATNPDIANAVDLIAKTGEAVPIDGVVHSTDTGTPWHNDTGAAIAVLSGSTDAALQADGLTPLSSGAPELLVSDTDLVGAAAAGLKSGVNRTNGNSFYVDAAGNWQQIDSSLPPIIVPTIIAANALTAAQIVSNGRIVIVEDDDTFTGKQLSWVVTDITAGPTFSTMGSVDVVRPTVTVTAPPAGATEYDLDQTITESNTIVMVSGSIDLTGTLPVDYGAQAGGDYKTVQYDGLEGSHRQRVTKIYNAGGSIGIKGRSWYRYRLSSGAYTAWETEDAGDIHNDNLPANIDLTGAGGTELFVDNDSDGQLSGFNYLQNQSGVQQSLYTFNERKARYYRLADDATGPVQIRVQGTAFALIQPGELWHVGKDENDNRFGVKLNGPQEPEDLLLEPRKRLEDAAFTGRAVQYAVAGDSTRENTYNELMAYYGHMFGKIGVTIVDSARSGHTAADWANDVSSPTLTELVAAVTGTGADAVVEFSYGLNDWTTEVATKTVLNDALVALEAALPNIEIVLATPVYTANAARNAGLAKIYQELANERNLPLINIYDAMEMVYDGAGPNVYYEDTTHPNSIGSKRLFHVMADQLLPTSLYSKMVIDEDYRAGSVAPGTNLAGAAEVGLWSNVDGSSNPNPAWRRLPRIAVVEGATYTHVRSVTDAGDRTDVQFMNAADDTLVLDTDMVAGSVVAPAGASWMKITLSNDGATYDGLGNVNTVTSDAPEIPTIAEVNTGLNIRLSVVPSASDNGQSGPDATAVTTVGEMTTNLDFYELTAADGGATPGLYLVRANGTPTQIQAF